MMIHALYHSAGETLGLIESALQDAGLAFREHYLYQGDLLPSAQDISGLIVMGGPMNVDEVDRYPFLKKEIELIRDTLCVGKPVLGICLGAQLMAKALGENVFPAAKKEVGWHPIEYTRHAASDPLFKALPSDLYVLHWHGDTFRVPATATPLALTTSCPSQAFRWKQNSYGLQFHFEVTPKMLESWCDAPSEQSFIAAAGEKPSSIKERTPRAFARLEPVARNFFSDYLKAAYPAVAAEARHAGI